LFLAADASRRGAYRLGQQGRDEAWIAQDIRGGDWSVAR